MVAVGIAAGILYFAGLTYLGLALFRVAQWRDDRPRSRLHPPVTVLVPAHGAPPRLAECLRSVCRQDYPAFQVVFGLHAADDPARAVIEALMAEHGGLDLELVIDSRRLGANPKNCNLANMMAAARHQVIVMVDSDVLVEPDFLAAMVAPLAEPGVGGVTCVYKATAEPGLAPALGTLAINDWFVPSVLVDVARRHSLSFAYGAAIAVTRPALERIGGFDAMASAVSQDFVIGSRLYSAGYLVRLASSVVTTVVAEPTLADLLRHELRWVRGIRAVRPRDHALSIVMVPLLPFVLLAGPTWPAAATAAAVAVLLAARLVLHRLLRRRMDMPAVDLWLLPVREVLTALVWASSFFGRRVRWGNSVMVTGEGVSMRVERSAEGSEP
jgi:ceramide glucosyltransferase